MNLSHRVHRDHREIFCFSLCALCVLCGKFFSIISINRSNSGVTSCGPGLASGCPWKQYAGLSVRSSPCTEPSNSERFDAPRGDFKHRVVRAVMSELHLDGARAGGQTHELMTETDAEHRQARVDNVTDRLHAISAWFGIAGAVREEHAVRFHL